GLAGDRFVERSMVDEIMYSLLDLSGQEYVDRYASSVKAARGSAAAAVDSQGVVTRSG
ncbi:MAG: 1-acyl-sn-glycerol-3-phosphate acyltransferase, partial [Pseudonocardiaceae bacterium]